MLKLLVHSNINNTEVEFETTELKILLDAIERKKENCSKHEHQDYESLYNKIKALYIFDRLPDKQSIKQIKDVLLSTDNITKDNIHNLKIENLQFSKRTFNCLNRAGITTLAEILCLSEEDLLKIRNLGMNSLNEIIETLKKHDLKLPNFANK